ncbi:uncharacterized protein LOC108677093, partial [Hyalella azteca]|uniref:Uncharacterized protein LOC108677093 n=1 Tax=Hyalella azteca TaxID=294128 RepID=A0A8B7P421_HYAAZ
MLPRDKHGVGVVLVLLVCQVVGHDTNNLFDVQHKHDIKTSSKKFAGEHVQHDGVGQHVVQHEELGLHVQPEHFGDGEHATLNEHDENMHDVHSLDNMADMKSVHKTEHDKNMKSEHDPSNMHDKTHQHDDMATQTEIDKKMFTENEEINEHDKEMPSEQEGNLTSKKHFKKPTDLTKDDLPTLCLCSPPCPRRGRDCPSGRMVPRGDCPCCLVCPREEGDACGGHDDPPCNLGLACSSGRCQPSAPCRDDNDCPPWLACLGGNCVDPCLPPPPHQPPRPPPPRGGF